jgi:hypothetical protein
VGGEVNGRRWAKAGAALGAVASLAANVAHALIAPDPELGLILSAVFWPLALLVAIEVLTRVAWPAGRRWVVLRFGGLLPVAAVTAVVSYQHMSGWLAAIGAGGFEATFGPVAVDGMMVICTGALVAAGAVAPFQSQSQNLNETGVRSTPVESQLATPPPVPLHVAPPPATDVETAPVLAPVARPGRRPVAAEVSRRSQVTVAVPFGRKEKGRCDCDREACRGGRLVSYDTWRDHHGVPRRSAGRAAAGQG